MSKSRSRTIKMSKPEEEKPLLPTKSGEAEKPKEEKPKDEKPKGCVPEAVSLVLYFFFWYLLNNFYMEWNTK